ncbi:DMT family transporter [Paludisphaera soli]|uniref:DMT family transporter n=1 Tax=Paludisphaera soli TaxID=2712865 RepID=UPI0013EC2213|nr:DMT family transporter [Paludisphaera soli]
MESSRTWAGVGCGVAAGAIWGVVFLAPELVRGFTPLQIAAARYVSYGLLAAVLVAPRRRRLTAMLDASAWRALAWLSLFGNVLYYVLLATAVQLGGVAMTSLVMGFVPVAITLIGSRDHGAVPLRRLAPSLALAVAGVACVAWQSVGVGGPGTGTPAMRVAGFGAAVAALVSWTGYAVGNSRWLARLGHVSAHDWNLLTGVVTGAQALLLAVPAFLFGPTGQAAAEWTTFAAVAIGLSIFASLIASALWSRMSRLLPLTLVGQMILFETLFALLYGFLWERRGPTPAEAAAMVLLVASVLSCLSAHAPAREPVIVADPVHP